MKDTEKAIKEEFSQTFKGLGQRQTMLSKLVLALLHLCTLNFAELALLSMQRSKQPAISNGFNAL